MKKKLNTSIIPKTAFLILPIMALVMALAFYIAFIPHQSYPYPLHVDEWVHLANSEAILKAASTTYPEPFFGVSTYSFSTNQEVGFQLFWGVFHQISGISWMTIFRYFPGVILMLTVLSVYVLAQRKGFGVAAAFFTTLIPTSIGILGTAFLVPVALGLLFTPLALFIAFYCRGAWSYVALFIFTCFLLAMHAPSAIAMAIILFPYILLNLKGNFKHSLGIFLAIAVPFIPPFFLIYDNLLPILRDMFAYQPLPDYVDIPHVLKAYGYLPISFCILGTFLLALRGDKKNYGLVLGLLALLVVLVTYFTFHYGLFIMYERGLEFMMLMAGILAGAGLMGVYDLKVPSLLSDRIKIPVLTQNAGKILSLALVVLVLVISLPKLQNARYYHQINDEDYQAFVWIKENVSGAYNRAILDPVKGTAFVAITGKYVYTRTHAFPTERDTQAAEFLSDNCTDSDFLAKNRISIVYTEKDCLNPDLTEVRENVYLLK